MSDEEKRDKRDGENVSEGPPEGQKPEPELEALEVFDELFATAELPLPPTPPAPEQEPPATQKAKPKRYLTDKLPPKAFFDWLLYKYPDKLTTKQKDAIATAYELAPATAAIIAKKVGVNPTTVKRAVGKLLDLYHELADEFERERGEKAAPQPEPEPEPEPKPKARKGGKKPAGDDNEGKITNAVYQMSKATTTFKEVDKTIANLLGAEFHDAAIKKNVYARLGELLIYTLLQLGAIDRDKIVSYSQQLVDDPDALYFYVKEQLDAVIKITDPDTLQRVWIENANLRMKVMALQATADMLSDALNYYAQVIRFLVSLLDKKQLEKFAMWIYMFEYMRKKRKAAKAVGGGKFAGTGFGD
ncbi:MAG: hypothetical protein J7K48_08040 [Thermococcus sp.]|nr:hypothetical protein [Thermococcus sp.]